MAVGLDQDTESLQRGSIPSGGAGTLSDGGFKNCFAGVWVYRPSSTATYALTAAGSIIHFQAGAREVALGFNSAGSALADLNLQIIFNSGGGAGTPATFSGHTGASFLDEWVYYFIADNPTDGQIAGYIRLADLATAVTQTRTNDNAGSQYVNTLTFGNTSGNNAVVLGFYAYARAAYDSTDGFNTTDALAFAASSVPGSGMWGFWPLDTNTDNVDDSGNGRDLTFNGTLTTETSPTFLTITSQPADATVNSGVAPVFSITATGATSYQWQDNSSGSFANVSGGSGATTATYTAPAAAYSHQGRLFRCVLNGSTNSNSATLRVEFNLTGTGPRAYPVLGGVIGAGSVESWLRGTDAGGGGSSGPVGTSTETDTAFNLGSARPAGLSSETDTALARTAVSVRATGLAAEADTSLALAPLQIRAAGTSTEADTALALSAVQRLAAGLATETDTALALSAVVGTAAGLSTETDTALARTAVQILAVGLAAETDTALALSASVGNQVGAAAETDTALALAGVQVRAAGLAAETDAALALAAVQARATGLATEADTALAMAAVQLRATGVAVETDSALGLSAGGAVPVGLAAETDTAFALEAVSTPQIVIPQTSFAEFSGAVVKTKQEPKQPRIKAPKAARQARQQPKTLEPVLTPVGMAIEASEALALQSWVIQRGLIRSAPKPAYPKLMRDSCPHCGAPAAHVHQ